MNYFEKLSVARETLLYRSKPVVIARKLSLEVSKVRAFLRTKECNRLKLVIFDGLTDREQRDLKRLYDTKEPIQEQLPL